MTMTVWVVQCGDPDSEIFNEVLDIFDNLTSAFYYVAEYEAELDEGIENRSYDFFLTAAID